MRIAIAHDWLVTIGGAERVLEQILKTYPDGVLYALIDFLDDEQRAVIGGKRAETSFLQDWPGVRTHHRAYLPIMPMAAESLPMGNHDVLLSSSYAVIKGVITGPDQLHICYCHSPMRYAWDLQESYLSSARLDRGFKGFLVRALLQWLRMWDLRTAPGVDVFVANSHYVARRIRKVYGRQAEVIYPPVDVDYFRPNGCQRETFYVTASRLVPYKRVDLIVEAFSRMPEKQLIVIGDGPGAADIEKRATPNVMYVGHQSRESVRAYFQKARAFIFAAEEDFGIAPLEAQACGAPVIAFGKGGALETIIGLSDPFPTGVHFPEQSLDSLCEAIEAFEANHNRISSDRCREQALHFSPERFRDELRQLVDREWTKFRQQMSRATSVARAGMSS